MTNGDVAPPRRFSIAFGNLGVFGAGFLIAFLVLTAIGILLDTKIPPWPTGACAGFAALFLVVGK